VAPADSRSREALLAELEQLTGLHFRTRDDVRDFVARLEAEKDARGARSVERWRFVKRSTLLALFALAVAQYFALDTLLQVMSLRELTVFVPVTARDVRS
jgi:hypothetical protein